MRVWNDKKWRKFWRMIKPSPSLSNRLNASLNSEIWSSVNCSAAISLLDCFLCWLLKKSERKREIFSLICTWLAGFWTKQVCFIRQQNKREKLLFYYLIPFELNGIFSFLLIIGPEYGEKVQHFLHYFWQSSHYTKLIVGPIRVQLQSECAADEHFSYGERWQSLLHTQHFSYGERW